MHIVTLIEPQARCMRRSGAIIGVFSVQVDQLRAIQMLEMVLRGSWIQVCVFWVDFFREILNQPETW